MSSKPSRLVAVLLLAAFVTFFDRSLLPPIFGPVSESLQVDREAVGTALTAYMFAYGISQLGWGVLLAWWGRTRVLVIALLGCLIGAVMSTVAGEYWLFMTGRVIAGTCFGALIPIALVYFGDTLNMHDRGRANANIAAALSLGLAVATIASPVIARYWTWQVGFGLVVAFVIAVLIGVLRDRGQATVQPVSVADSLRRVMRNSWAWLVLGLMLLEGAILVGVVSYLPAALEAYGTDPATAGLAVGLFGFAVIAWSFLVKRLIPIVPAYGLLGLGGTAAVVAYLVLTVVITVPSVVVAAVLLGFAWAAAHTQLQTWMTDTVHDARAVGMSLLGVLMFVGASIGSAVSNVAATAHVWPPLFLGSMVVAVLFTVAAAIGRRYYPQHAANIAPDEAVGAASDGR